MPEPRFLLLSVPDAVKTGSSLRLVATANSEEEADQKLQGLDASIMGRVAIVEVKNLYERRPAVQNIPSDRPLLEAGT